MWTLLTLQDDYNMTEETGRITIWKRGISVMLARPQGSGIAAFQAAEGSIGGRYQAAHNTLIQVGVELGLLGLLVFLLMYKSAFGALQRIDNEMALAGDGPSRIDAELRLLRAYVVGARGALIGFFITSFFLSSAYSSLLYVLFGLIGGLDVVHRRITQSEASQEESLDVTNNYKMARWSNLDQAKVAS
jgi:O-antigen ligase